VKMMVATSRSRVLGREWRPIRGARRLSLALLGTALGVAFSAPTVFGGEPGQLDPSFGRDGLRIIDFGRNESAEAVFRRDDRLVLIGRQQVEQLEPYNVAVTRLGSDGRIDRSFGDEGRILVRPTEKRYNLPFDWASAPDGGLLVLGLERQRWPLSPAPEEGRIAR